jgi:3-deoxy-D-manno-octulosonic-acid transferase
MAHRHWRSLLIFFYYCLTSIVVVLATPILFFRAKSRPGLLQKLGFVPSNLTVSGKSAWFHAVSVGEFNAIRPLLDEFHKRYPEITVIVSTTTATGQKLAKEKVGQWAKVVYLPYDTIWALKPWLSITHPSLFVIAETEIWPGLTHECSQRSIPIVIVNARISPRSFKSYYFWRALFKPVLRQFRYIGAQTEEEGNRYRKIMSGTETADQIQVIGNLKFDGLKPVAEQTVDDLHASLNLSRDSKVIVGGSTHEGEELALIQAFASLREKHPGLKLILVPRHPERFNEVAELIAKSGFACARFSQDGNFAADKDVFLLDAIGHLMEFYALADVAFVGGTIYPLGGHNLMEPFVYKVPVVCGTHLDKIKDVAVALLARQALFKVADVKELTRSLDQLLSQPELAVEIGERGHELIVQGSGATLRALTLIETALSGKSEGRNATYQSQVQAQPPFLNDLNSSPTGGSSEFCTDFGRAPAQSSASIGGTTI